MSSNYSVRRWGASVRVRADSPEEIEHPRKRKRSGEGELDLSLAHTIWKPGHRRIFDSNPLEDWENVVVLSRTAREEYQDYLMHMKRFGNPRGLITKPLPAPLEGQDGVFFTEDLPGNRFLGVYAGETVLVHADEAARYDNSHAFDICEDLNPDLVSTSKQAAKKAAGAGKMILKVDGKHIGNIFRNCNTTLVEEEANLYATLVALNGCIEVGIFLKNCGAKAGMQALLFYGSDYLKHAGIVDPIPLTPLTFTLDRGRVKLMYPLSVFSKKADVIPSEFERASLPLLRQVEVAQRASLVHVSGVSNFKVIEKGASKVLVANKKFREGAFVCLGEFGKGTPVSHLKTERKGNLDVRRVSINAKETVVCCFANKVIRKGDILALSTN